MSEAHGNVDILFAQYPDMGRELLSDILRECGGDRDTALAVLKDMTSEKADASTAPTVTANRNEAEHHLLKHMETLAVSDSSFSRDRSCKNPSMNEVDIDAFEEEFARLQTNSDRALAMAVHKQENADPRHTDDNGRVETRRQIALGPWASKRPSGSGDLSGLSYAGELCVKRISEKYRWADKRRIAALHSATGECEALTEELLLAESPELTFVACTGGPSARPQLDDSPSIPSHTGSQKPMSSSAEKSHVAEALRLQDVLEMSAMSRQGGDATVEHKIESLKLRLATLTGERDNHQALYAKTRKSHYARESNRLEQVVSSAWSDLLTAIRSSPAFRSGEVDLHGLNADQAIQVVDVKLAEGAAGGRTRFITGRGNHSAGGPVGSTPATGIAFDQLGLNLYSRCHAWDNHHADADVTFWAFYDVPYGDSSDNCKVYVDVSASASACMFADICVPSCSV